MQPDDPHRIGPYRVSGRFGVGGMGTVYAALDASGQRIAVKSLHPALAADEEFRSRFRREVRISMRVKGPCLVPVHDADTDGPTPWLATCFVPGPTLEQHLAASGALEGARLYALAAGVAAALAAIHEAGVVHRDMKPQNVILAPAGPRVLDFGIAHALGGTSVTRTGVLTGTPGWISPEHYRTGEVSAAGDVFAWGALVAYAATGRLPFGTGAPDAVAFRVICAEPDLVGVPDALLPLVERALAKEPGDRPSAAELRDRCIALLAAQATSAAARGQQPTLVADLVSAHWDLSLGEDVVWGCAVPRRARLRVSLAIAAAAAVAGAVGGVLAASGDAAEQKPQAAPADNKRKATTGSSAPAEVGRQSPNSSASPPSTAASSAAEARTPAPAPSLSLRPAPFTYLPDQLDCTPPRQPEVEGAWQYFSVDDVRAGDAVELGIRNKYGNFDPVQAEMSLLARVYMPDGTSRLARTTIRSDTPATVTWPGDFPGTTAHYPPGTYTVVWLTGDDSDRFITCTGFTAQ
nr:serine/threonine-protein kinase [Streptomyces carminius]